MEKRIGISYSNNFTIKINQNFIVDLFTLIWLLGVLMKNRKKKKTFSGIPKHNYIIQQFNVLHFVQVILTGGKTFRKQLIMWVL